MSRNKKDWIQDVIINPAIVGSYLTPETITKKLKNFSIFETYPKFTDDYVGIKIKHIIIQKKALYFFRKFL